MLATAGLVTLSADRKRLYGEVAGVIGEVSGLVLVVVVELDVFVPVVLTPCLPVFGIRMSLMMMVAIPAP